MTGRKRTAALYSKKASQKAHDEQNAKIDRQPQPNRNDQELGCGRLFFICFLVAVPCIVGYWYLNMAQNRADERKEEEAYRLQEENKLAYKLRQLDLGHELKMQEKSDNLWGNTIFFIVVVVLSAFIGLGIKFYMENTRSQTQDKNDSDILRMQEERKAKENELKAENFKEDRKFEAAKCQSEREIELRRIHAEYAEKKDQREFEALKLEFEQKAIMARAQTEHDANLEQRRMMEESERRREHEAELEKMKGYQYEAREWSEASRRDAMDRAERKGYARGENNSRCLLS